MKKLTVIQSPQACKTCVFENEKIVSKTTPIYSGIARCMKWESLEDLIPFINGNFAFIHGIPRRELNCRTGNFELTTLKNQNIDAKQIARARKNFQYDEEAIVLLDIDEPKDAGYIFNDIHTLITDIRELYPVLQDKELLAIPSSSNGLINKETLRPIKANSTAKWHIYFRIKSNLIAAFKQYLQDFAWAKGYGYVHVSRSGAVLQRCIVDLNVFSPERIDYIGSIKDKTGLIIENKPEPVFIAGDVITEIPANPYIQETEKLFHQERMSAVTKEKVYSMRKSWLERQVKEGRLKLTTIGIKRLAKKFAEREHHYDCLPSDIKMQVGKRLLTPFQISEQLRNLKGNYCADPFTGEDCKCKIVAAPYADLGFLLYSYKMQGYYYFGSSPTPITESQIKMGKHNLTTYLANMPKSPKLNCISHWRQAAHIDNQWYNFWESYNGVTTIANILLAKSEYENDETRASENAYKITNAINRYFDSTEEVIGNTALFVGNPGDGKSYAAKLAIAENEGASLFITNTNKNVHDFSDTAFTAFFNVYGNTTILWQLLKKQFGYSDDDKKQFDSDVAKHYAANRKNLFDSLTHWFNFKLLDVERSALEVSAKNKLKKDYYRAVSSQQSANGRFTSSDYDVSQSKDGLRAF